MAVTGELKDMLKSLLEERKTLEAELREERKVRAEEAAKRDEAMREQMELLRGLVCVGTGVGARSGGGGVTRTVPLEPKVVKLTDSDDIEAYIVIFKRLMAAYDVPENRWVFKLAPQLSGKAQQAYAALSGEAAADYSQVKEAILRRYGVNEKSYRKRFRGASVKNDETVVELCVRLDDLAKKWTKDCSTVDKLRDVIVLEQLLLSLPSDVRVWVQEYKPKSSGAAAQLADDYIQARQVHSVASTLNGVNRSGSPNQIVCRKCKQRGHKARDCKAGIGDTTSPPHLNLSDLSET